VRYEAASVLSQLYDKQVCNVCVLLNIQSSLRHMCTNRRCSWRRQCIYPPS